QRTLRRRIDVEAIDVDRAVGNVADADDRVEAARGVDQELREDQNRRRVIGGDVRQRVARHRQTDREHGGRDQRDQHWSPTIGPAAHPQRAPGPSGMMIRSVLARVPRSSTLNAARACCVPSRWYSSNTPTIPELAASDVRKKLWAKRVCNVGMRNT